MMLVSNFSILPLLPLLWPSEPNHPVLLEDFHLWRPPSSVKSTGSGGTFFLGASKNGIWIVLEPSFREDRLGPWGARQVSDIRGWLVPSHLFSGRNDRVGPWMGVDMLGNWCVHYCGAHGHGKRGQRVRKEVFFAHLLRVLRNAGTGNAQRFTDIYWTPNWQIWESWKRWRV